MPNHGGTMSGTTTAPEPCGAMERHAVRPPVVDRAAQGDYPTHNAGVAGSSPAPAIAQPSVPHRDTGVVASPSPTCGTTSGTNDEIPTAESRKARGPRGDAVSSPDAQADASVTREPDAVVRGVRALSPERVSEIREAAQELYDALGAIDWAPVWGKPPRPHETLRADDALAEMWTALVGDASDAEVRDA